eukprot:7179074-Alexandrium_andersonii.AAC.1
MASMGCVLSPLVRLGCVCLAPWLGQDGCVKHSGHRQPEAQHHEVAGPHVSRVLRVHSSGDRSDRPLH